MTVNARRNSAGQKTVDGSDRARVMREETEQSLILREMAELTAGHYDQPVDGFDPVFLLGWLGKRLGDIRRQRKDEKD